MSERKWFLSGVAAALLAAALFYFGYMIIPAGGNASRPDSIQTIKKAKQIEGIIDRYYLGEIDEKTQTDMMFVGQVAGLGDQYSRYYTKEEYEQLHEKRQGAYTGIGITFIQQADDGSMVILSVQEGSPAEAAGLMENDVMLTVDGRDTSEMTTGDLVELIQENDGNEIEMTVSREGAKEPVTVYVTPGNVETITVTSEMLSDAVGVIRISQFAYVTAEQYQTAYEDLLNQGMKKMILDLRGNGGGLVESACAIAEQILPEGVIVYEEDKNGNRKDHNANGTSEFDLPLAVLVNDNTASASEILTGAIQDYGIGTVVGTQTFGKGIVQNVFRLSDGSVIQLTVTHYYTPNGNDIHEKGITPDVIVEAAEDEDAADDPQMAAALRVVSDLPSGS